MDWTELLKYAAVAAVAWFAAKYYLGSTTATKATPSSDTEPQLLGLAHKLLESSKDQMGEIVHKLIDKRYPTQPNVVVQPIIQPDPAQPAAVQPVPPAPIIPKA